MFRKYEKTFRLPLPGFPTGTKLSLISSQIKQLLSGSVVIEEKLDGANVGIIRHKGGFHLQKRGSLVGASEHEQFNFFKNWATNNYDKIMELPLNTIVYGELLYAVHHIYYDKLPDYIIIFDVRHKDRYLGFQEKLDFCEKYKYQHVPILSHGYFDIPALINLVPKKSKFGDRAEGMVVKKYHKKKDYMKGKVVWPDFIKEINELQHWTSEAIRINKLEIS